MPKWQLGAALRFLATSTNRVDTSDNQLVSVRKEYQVPRVLWTPPSHVAWSF